MLPVDHTTMSFKQAVFRLFGAFLVIVTMCATTVRGADEALTAVASEQQSADVPTDAVAAIAWRSDLATAKAEAIATGRPLLIEYTSKSCGWCRAMEKYTHTDADVIATLNNQFVPVRVSGDPEKLRKPNGVRGTPATLIVDAATMTKLKRIDGFVRPRRYVQKVNATFQLVSLFQKSPEAMAILNQASTAYQKKQMNEAIELATQGLALCADSADLLALRGTSYYQLGDATRAIADFDDAIKARGDQSGLYLQRGMARYLDGEYAAADEDFVVASKLPYGYPNYIIAQRWFALNANGQKEEALAVMRESFHGYKPDRDDLWFRWLVLFQGGYLTEERVTSYAKNSYQKMQLGRTLAMKAKLAGDVEGARAHLMKIKNIAKLESYEHPVIMYELEALGKMKTSD